MPSAGDVVEVTVRLQTHFGVFVDMGDEQNALILATCLYDTLPFSPTEKLAFPPVGRRLTAVVLGRKRDGQFQLSLRRADFARFSRELEWKDWTK
jgi:predicted RNA-binding protein with RPS1 domain